MLSWIRRWRTFRQAPAHRTPPRRAPGFLPRLEPLERRDLLAAGALDPLFGGTGKIGFTFGEHRDDRARAIVAQPDGELVLVGLTKQADGDWDMFVARLNGTDGSFDTTFNRTGKR